MPFPAFLPHSPFTHSVNWLSISAPAPWNSDLPIFSNFLFAYDLWHTIISKPAWYITNILLYERVPSRINWERHPA